VTAYSPQDVPRVGEQVGGGWSVTAFEARHGALRLTVTDGTTTTTLGLAVRGAGEDTGAFGTPQVRCWYQGRSMDTHGLGVAAAAIVARLGDAPVHTLSQWVSRATQTSDPEVIESESRPARGQFSVPAGQLLAGFTAGDTRVRDGSLELAVVEPCFQGMPRRPAIVLRATLADGGLGPFGRDGVRVTHAGSHAPDGLGRAAEAWLVALEQLSGVGARLAVMAAVHDPANAGLATARRHLRVQPSRTAQTEAHVAEQLALLNATLTSHITIDVGGVDAALADALTHRLTARVPDGIEVSFTQSGGATPSSTAANCAVLPGELELVRLPPGDAEIDPNTDGQSWQDAVRERLVDHPERSLRLRDVLTEAELPAWPCALPWVRFEVSPNGWVGPCCRDYQAVHHKLPRDAQPEKEWNSEGMRAFRRAMTAGGHPETCAEACPFLNAGTQRPGEVRLVGGPTAHVENGLLVVQDMLDGAEVMKGKPLEVCVAATTFCNYDCLMCDYGATGTLDDELPPAFWQGLDSVLHTAQFLEVNGGEPLASPVFRDFLETIDVARTPQLRVLLITNGSYLGAKQLSKYRAVPFENITLSINAAAPHTYEVVNKGLPWSRARKHLDAIRDARRAGQLRGRVQYSMVLLKQNFHEIDAFVNLADADGAAVRFQLPLKDRNSSSIMTDRSVMIEALEGLERAAARLLLAGRLREARGAAGNAQVIWQRLAAGIYTPL
jgi:hypothetical protein